jgi:hypothetical protein
MQRLEDGVKQIDKISKKQGIISAFLEKAANMFGGQEETTDGGPGSGHFGHKGRPGFVGGSGKGGSSVSSGEKLERQGTAIAKGIETHTASGNESARQKLAGRLDGILEKLSGTSYNVQTKQREDPEEFLKPGYPEVEAEPKKEGAVTSEQREVIGKGSTGEVFRIGDKAYKNAVKPNGKPTLEGEVYQALEGVDGIAPGKQVEMDGQQYIETPYYKDFVKVMTFQKKSAVVLLLLYRKI